MSIIDLARLVIYRFHEKGMEVFLINSDLKNDPDVWKLPPMDITKLTDGAQDDFIEVEVDGERLIAVEGDWHNIPSIKGLIRHDVKVVKNLVKETIPGAEKGAFFAMKETVKKVMPQQYKALKELKDILIESNSIRNI